MPRYIALLMILISVNIYSQTEYKKHLTDLIHNSTIDSIYNYLFVTDKGDTLISEITYYGKTNKDIKIFYIHETYPAACVRHGFYMLYLIDSRGKKFYYRDIDKPLKLDNGFIYFSRENSKGLKYLFKADLNKEIPLFLCQDKDDCYSYQIDE